MWKLNLVAVWQPPPSPTTTPHPTLTHPATKKENKKKKKQVDTCVTKMLLFLETMTEGWDNLKQKQHIRRLLIW